MSVLTIHLYVGVVVVISAVLLVWRRSQRRIPLYLLTLQIMVGIVALFNGYPFVAAHVVPAVIGWAGFMAASAIEKRPGKIAVARIVAAVSTLCILAAFGVGQHLVRASGTGSGSLSP